MDLPTPPSTGHGFAFRRSISPRARTIIFGLLGITVLVCALYAVDYTSRLGGDYSFYFSNGWFLHRGLRPYVDFWSHKTPLLPMALAIWIGICGASFYSAVTFLIVVTLLCSFAVVGLASTMKLRPGICILSGAFYALFASMHALDPERNGIIITFASIFELLSLSMLVLGLRHKSFVRTYLSGVFEVMAVASRQTSLAVCLALFAIILASNGRRGLRQSLRQCLFVALGCLSAAAALLGYLYVNGADLPLLWDQLVHFNLVYAGHFWGDSSILEWGYFWTAVFTDGFLLYCVAALAYLVANLRRQPGRAFQAAFDNWVLPAMFSAHLVAVLLARMEQPFYGLQFFPELSVMAGIVFGNALAKPYRIGHDLQPDGLRAGLIIASAALMLFVPIREELRYAYLHLRDATEGGYLTDIGNAPWYKDEVAVADKIREIAQDPNDRVWLLQYGNDLVYVLANRLPATRFTQGAGLADDDYAEEATFKVWLDEFTRQRPKVVVIYPDLVTPYRVTLQRIQAVVAATMVRVDTAGQLPEIYR